MRNITTMGKCKGMKMRGPRNEEGQQDRRKQKEKAHRFWVVYKPKTTKKGKLRRYNRVQWDYGKEVEGKSYQSDMGNRQGKEILQIREDTAKHKEAGGGNVGAAFDINQM